MNALMDRFGFGFDPKKKKYMAVEPSAIGWEKGETLDKYLRRVDNVLRKHGYVREFDLDKLREIVAKIGETPDTYSQNPDVRSIISFYDDGMGPISSFREELIGDPMLKPAFNEDLRRKIDNLIRKYEDNLEKSGDHQLALETLWKQYDWVFRIYVLYRDIDNEDEVYPEE